MAPEPDPNSERGSQIFIAQESVKKKPKIEQPQTERIAEFRLDPKQLIIIKNKLKVNEIDTGHTTHILGKIYEGLKVKDAPEEGKEVNIIYEENRGLIREPTKILKDGKADCDEATRTAYLLAWESGVRNIQMVEMSWTDPKTNERTGHSFIVLTPKNKNEQPLIYDFTYHKKEKPLLVEGDVGAAIIKEYAADAANPNFRITMRNNLNEVEAAHYEWVGKYFAKPHTQNWKKVEEAYSKAVKLMPTTFEYSWGLAVSYEKQFRWKDALEQYKRCMIFEEGKSNPKVLAAAGVAYANTENMEEAKKLLKKALEHNPDETLRKRIESRLKEIETR